MYTVTELKNILRMYQYTSSALAADIGISKSFLSKIINLKLISQKHEKMIVSRILELQKTEPKYIIKKRNYKYFKYLPCIHPKDIALRNGIQIILSKKKITITQLSLDINEERSHVSRVIMGVRHTLRIKNKIINYFKLDRDIYFNRCGGDIFKLQEGLFVPLPTKAEAKRQIREFEQSLNNLKNYFSGDVK